MKWFKYVASYFKMLWKQKLLTSNQIYTESDFWQIYNYAYVTFNNLTGKFNLRMNLIQYRTYEVFDLKVTIRQRDLETILIELFAPKIHIYSKDALRMLA
jgi:hypothetical protein